MTKPLAHKLLMEIDFNGRKKKQFPKNVWKVPISGKKMVHDDLDKGGLFVACAL